MTSHKLSENVLASIDESVDLIGLGQYKGRVFIQLNLDEAKALQKALNARWPPKAPEAPKAKKVVSVVPEPKESED